MEKYDPQRIEPKWQERWEKEGIYKAEFPSKKKKYYVLIEFPYPSGERLHVGHARSYSAMDAIARKRRMQGYNVLYPIGWDAFGLPAENYAIKTGVHPAVTTRDNIANARAQAKSWGLSFDWSREINTTDPSYYKWTQWIFLQLYKHGLAYRDEIAVNWCPSCKINLANEEVIDGRCERCGYQTNRKMQKQWMLRITAYADRLLEDLGEVDYRQDIERMQREWIGRKEGIEISYSIEGSADTVTVFTTRPDTNFGATFIVLSPEHSLADRIATSEYASEVHDYIHRAQEKTELERIQEARQKTGAFTGRYAVNPLNGYQMPIWVSDFVLGNVGTGAVVGVPGHDRRDFEFAQQFGLPIKRVVVGPDGDESEVTRVEQVQEEAGRMVNSGFLDGMEIHEAVAKMMDYLEEKGWGKRTISYHLRDWVFSRQHYWGEPIPIVYCDSCGEVPVPEEDLPVELPHVERYEPTDTGKSPLANVKDWVDTKCPKCGGSALRETDTMPNWAGSSWYFLRYCDPRSNKALASWESLEYFLPVDWYNGGLEHTTLHLLYSRFWHKFLFDIGAVPTIEPYAKRTSHGVVLGPDGTKMSKSKGNVINPDAVVSQYGADSFRVYEMFMGPFEEQIVWNGRALAGVRRFLERIWQSFLTDQAGGFVENGYTNELESHLHRTIKKVGEDIETLKFNTAIAAMMKFINKVRVVQQERDVSGMSKKHWNLFTRLLAPFAPHLTEELWQKFLGGGMETFVSVHHQPWPKYRVESIGQEEIIMAVQINGRTRATVSILNAKSGHQEEVEALSKKHRLVQRYLTGKKVRRVIFVPGRIINFITE